ncbi:MAG TPA: F0F1 ATP synthase subunit delta [Stellaceae bacterium]|nr:F0F1 ATP synthase subunit delta [Stellaceae bacterium]
MASEATGVSGLAERYARALFDLADEGRTLDQVAADLKSLAGMLAESGDLRRLIRSPVLDRAAQGRAVAALAARAELSPLTRKFLGLLARNRRLFALPAMIAAFLSHLAARRGEVTAQVVSAAPLTAAQSAALAEALRQSAGAKLTIDAQVDPSLLGGLVVRLGSRMIDASLKSKLNRLQLAMKGVG